MPKHMINHKEKLSENSSNEGKYFTEKKKPKKQTTQKRKKKIVGELISIIN